MIQELTPRVLSESTQGRGIIKTSEFTPEYLRLVLDRSLKNKEQRVVKKRKEIIEKKFGFIGRIMGAIWFSPKLNYLRKNPIINIIIKKIKVIINV